MRYQCSELWRTRGRVLCEVTTSQGIPDLVEETVYHCMSSLKMKVCWVWRSGAGESWVDPSWGLIELGVGVREGEFRVMVRVSDVRVDGGIIPKRETGEREEG